jgi:hypothetical protein
LSTLQSVSVPPRNVKFSLVRFLVRIDHNRESSLQLCCKSENERNRWVAELTSAIERERERKERERTEWRKRKEQSRLNRFVEISKSPEHLTEEKLSQGKTINNNTASLDLHLKSELRAVHEELYDFEDSRVRSHPHRQGNGQNQVIYEEKSHLTLDYFPDSSLSHSASARSLASDSLASSLSDSSSFLFDSSLSSSSSSAPSSEHHFHYYYFNRDLDRQKKSTTLLRSALAVLLAIVILTLGHSDRSIQELSNSRVARTVVSFLSDSISSVSSEDLAELKDNFEALDASIQAQAVSIGNRIARNSLLWAPCLTWLLGIANFLLAVKKVLIGENKRNGTGAPKSFFFAFVFLACSFLLPYFQ